LNQSTLGRRAGRRGRRRWSGFWLRLAHTARLRRKVRKSLLDLKLSWVAVKFVTPELENALRPRRGALQRRGEGRAPGLRFAAARRPFPRVEPWETAGTAQRRWTQPCDCRLARAVKRSAPCAETDELRNKTSSVIKCPRHLSGPQMKSGSRKLKDQNRWQLWLFIAANAVAFYRACQWETIALRVSRRLLRVWPIFYPSGSLSWSRPSQMVS
jgi:hypothetical protein